MYPHTSNCSWSHDNIHGVTGSENVREEALTGVLGPGGYSHLQCPAQVDMFNWTSCSQQTQVQFQVIPQCRVWVNVTVYYTHTFNMFYPIQRCSHDFMTGHVQLQQNYLFMSRHSHQVHNGMWNDDGAIVPFYIRTDLENIQLHTDLESINDWLDEMMPRPTNYDLVANDYMMCQDMELAVAKHLK